MSEYELIDVVNEKDEVIGVVERTPEWNKTRPGICRVVNVMVWNSKGELILQQRSKTKNVSPLQFDTSVGGLVTSGLTYEEAAIKEMEEELGINTDLKFVTSFTYTNPETGKVRGHHHLFECVSDGPYSNWEEEAERLEYMTMEEVHKYLDRFPYFFTVGFKEAFKNYLDAKSK